METGDTLRVADVPAPDTVKVLDDPESVVATVTAPTREIEPEEEVLEGEEGEEGEGVEGEAAEGEAPEGGSEEPAADAAGDQGTVEG